MAWKELVMGHLRRRHPVLQGLRGVWEHLFLCQHPFEEDPMKVLPGLPAPTLFLPEMRHTHQTFHKVLIVNQDH